MPYKQYFRGHWDSRQWRFFTTGPLDPDWLPVEHPTLGLWEALRDVVFRKYQRKRINYRLLESIDKIIAGLRESGEGQAVVEEAPPVLVAPKPKGKKKWCDRD